MADLTSLRIWLSYRAVKLANWLNPQLVPCMLEVAEREGFVGRGGDLRKILPAPPAVKEET